MHKFNYDISKIACIFCIILFFGGCDSASEPPKTAQVVSKKIVIAKPSASKPAMAKKVPPAAVHMKSPSTSVAPTPATKKAMPVPPQPPTISTKSAVQSKTSQAQKAEDVKAAPKMKMPASVQADVVPPKKPAQPASQIVLLSDIYDPAGKLDPFLPLYKEEPVAKAKKEKKKKRRLPLTPLEKVDLSQLKLVGIIRAPSGNRAMVQEASGKGYIVKKGTYIGINAGRVIEILKDRLIVLEEVETALGTYKLQKRELTIKKPPGEM